MTSDFETWSVAAGCKLGEFADLPPATQRKLIRLMARISEKSFRRGFQHGVVNKNTLCVDPAKLRFDVSLDIAPYTDSPGGGHTAIARLFMEYGVLRQIGFIDPDYRCGSIDVPKRALTKSAAKMRREAKRRSPEAELKRLTEEIFSL